VANAGFAGGFQYGGIGHSGRRDLRVVVGIKSITSLLRRPETRMFLGVILAAGAIAVMTMSGAPG
jgi:hypothetical protein